MKAKGFWLVAVLLAVLSLSTLNVEAASTYYVRSGASGANNGADWTNAYTALPATLVRGAIYYVAGGSYPGYTFDDPVSGSLVITIKKATIADHGTGTGWVDSYGTAQAVFGTAGSIGMYIKSGYVVMDGQTGGGPSGWTSNLGFKLNKLYVMGSGTVYNVTIRHADIDAGRTATTSDCNNARPIYTNGIDGFTLSYCYIHNSADDVWTAVGTTNNVIVEYSKWAYSYQNVACHPDLMQMYGGQYANITWRHNYIYALKVTYLWGIHQGFTVTNYEIYGNIIEFTPPGVFDSSTSDGLVGNLDSAGTFNTLKFYNNTIVGDWSYNVGFGNPNLTPGSNLVAYNNIWVKLSQSGSNGYGGWGGVTHANNTGYNTSTLGDTTTTGNPFVNSAGHDFRLAAATAAGTTLPSPYNMDMYGNVRGADGVWDRGAIEYNSGVSGDHEIPPLTLQ